MKVLAHEMRELLLVDVVTPMRNRQCGRERDKRNMLRTSYSVIAAPRSEYRSVLGTLRRIPLHFITLALV